MDHVASRLQSSAASEHRARSRHSHAVEHQAGLQRQANQLSRDITDVQAQIDASYSASFICFRSIVAAAKRSEAAFSSLLSPLIDHAETLVQCCDAALLQLQVTRIARFHGCSSTKMILVKHIRFLNSLESQS